MQASASMRWFVAIAFLVFVPAPSAAPMPDKAPQRFEDGMMIRFHMHENYGVVRAIERLLLRGKLEEAKQLAAAIGEAPDEPGLSALSTRAAEVRRKALEVARAKTLAEAISREAQLAHACATCHADAGVIPDLESPPPVPPDRDTIDARMARHLWAADRLWVGIVADSPTAWTSGLELLARGSRVWPALPASKVTFADRLQRTAETARRMKTTPIEKRAETYGALLEVCASCHTN